MKEKNEEEIKEITPEIIKKLAEKVKEEAKISTGVEEKAEVETEKPSKVSEEISLEIEKLKTMVEMMREERKIMDEKITTLIENFGELRTMLLQVESGTKMTSSKIEIMEETLSFLKPERFEKTLKEINQKIEKNTASIELQNEKLKKVIEDIAEVQRKIKEMGSIENISRINKEIKNKLDEMEAIRRRIELFSSKTERMYLEMAASREEILRIKSKVESLDEITKDLIKGEDAINLKIEELSTKKDVDEIKRKMEESLVEVNKKIENLQQTIASLEAVVPKEAIQLKRERDNLLSWIKSLEEDVKKGKITKEAYEEARKTCTKELARIDEEIAKLWGLEKKPIKKELKKE
jgi:chromosome segregation ATPase